MPRPAPPSSSQRIASAYAQTSRALAQAPGRDLAAGLHLGFDPGHDGHLTGLAEGLLGDAMQESRLEQRIGDLRQASGSAASFRQAVFLLMRTDHIAPDARVELMQRAMRWYRARAAASGQGGSRWAKSMVAIAHAQSGKLSK